MRISQINLKIIQDSRGKDTLEAVMEVRDLSAVASVPAGKSKGKLETSSVDPSICLQKFAEIKNELLNFDFSHVLQFDNFLKKMDGTPDKSNLGGNLTLVLSIAFTKLFAKSNNLQTYRLIGKILNKNPEKLKADISENFGEVRVGDEGAFAIKSSDPILGLEILNRNLDRQDVSLALDVAGSTFFTNGKYKIGEKVFDTTEMFDLYQNLVSKFPLLSIEDPFSEDDKLGFVKICQLFKDNPWIIGDDLTVTNKELIQTAIDEKLMTGVIIKPNQIGSVSETLDAIKLAQDNNLKIIVSHRSGETNDDFIADLAFGCEADGLKSGSPTQAQRLVKYNRLIEIERELWMP